MRSAAAIALALTMLSASAAEGQTPPASSSSQPAGGQQPLANPAANPAPSAVAAPKAPSTRANGKGATPTTDLPAFVTDEAIAVSSDYRGSTVNIIGMKPGGSGRGDVVVALRGPNQPTTVRRKTRFLMLWVNGEPVRFDAAPSFLAVVSARPLREIATPRAIWALKLDPAASAQLASATPAGADASNYRRALVRLRQQAGLYVEDPRGLRPRARVMFTAQIKLPANAPIGRYVYDTYFFRRGRLVSTASGAVEVSRQGLERTVYDIATRQSLLYGLGVVLFAIGAGWIAALLFRRS